MTSWGNYLTRGAYVPIYHMANEDSFNSKTANGSEYFPPTYESDGFIHATKDPSLLMEIGNHFYKSDVGAWILLELDPYFLLGTVVYEAPAPVGNTAAREYENAPKMPHIYGGIPLRSISKKLRIQRDEEGSFLGIIRD